MQLHTVEDGIRVVLFMREWPEPLIGYLSNVKERPVQEVFLGQVEPLRQLFPVWVGAEVERSDEAPNATIDLSRISTGTAIVRFAKQNWNFNRVAEVRFFTIGLPRDQGGFKTRAAFPVLWGDAYADLPLDVDLADFLSDRTAALTETYAEHLREPSKRAEHYVVVYPLEITVRSASFLAVERTVMGGAHGDYDLTAFSYVREKNVWRRIDWESQVWRKASGREVFKERSVRLATALETNVFEPQSKGWVALPVAGKTFVKFGTYMIGPYAVMMPEMMLPVGRELLSVAP